MEYIIQQHWLNLISCRWSVLHPMYTCLMIYSLGAGPVSCQHICNHPCMATRLVWSLWGGKTRGGEVCGCHRDLVNRHLLLLLEPQVLLVDFRSRLKAVSSATSKYLMTSGAWLKPRSFPIRLLVIKKICWWRWWWFHVLGHPRGLFFFFLQIIWENVAQDTSRRLQ